MVDYIFIDGKEIPKDMHILIGRLFNTCVQPRKYIYAFKYSGYIYSGALDHTSITSRGSIMEFLKNQPRTSVQELKEFLVLYQLNPHLTDLIKPLEITHATI